MFKLNIKYMQILSYFRLDKYKESSITSNRNWSMMWKTGDGYEDINKGKRVREREVREDLEVSWTRWIAHTVASILKWKAIHESTTGKKFW